MIFPNFLLDFYFLIPAQTGNRIINMCVYNDKLQATFVSWILTFFEIGCMNKPPNNQIFKISQKNWFLWLFFNLVFKIALWTTIGRSQKNNQIIKNVLIFWFFEYFDFEKNFFRQTDRQTYRTTNIWPYRSHLPSLKNILTPFFILPVFNRFCCFDVL